jgi:Fibronectin type III domain
MSERLFVSTDGSGNISTIKDYLDRLNHIIITGNFGGDGHTDLLFYRRSKGEGLFVTTDGAGNIADLKQYTDWDKDWDLIIPGNFGGDGHTDLLFYRRSKGEGLFVTTDGAGNIANLKQYTNWDKDWDLIIPGNFGGDDHTDLLFYRQRRFPPEAPTRLRVTNIAAGRIDVSWLDNSVDEDGFRIRFRGKREGQADHVETRSYGPNTVTASLTNLLNKYEYTISVVAFNAAGESPSPEQVRATTPNVPQTITVNLQRQEVIQGFVPYLGKYPPFGNVPPGRLLQIRVPESGLQDTAISFVKQLGHSTTECGNPNAVVVVIEGETTSPEKMTAIFGVPQPKYSSLNPVLFVACVAKPPGQFPDLVDIEITLMED